MPHLNPPQQEARHIFSGAKYPFPLWEPFCPLSLRERVRVRALLHQLTDRRLTVWIAHL